MNVKKQTVWPNPIQDFSWFEFWHPAQAAALESEERQNKELMRYNYLQDLLEAETSDILTEMDNQKFILIVAIIAFAAIIISIN